MDTNTVVKQHELKNLLFSLVSGTEVIPVKALSFERLEERFSAGVIVGCARPGHALNTAGVCNSVAEVAGRKLTPAVSMENETSLWMPVGDGFVKRRDCQVTVNRVADGPADYATVIQVNDAAKIQPALVCGHIREVRYPLRIRGSGFEILLEQVGKWLHFRVNDCGTHSLLERNRNQLGKGHEAPDTSPTGIDPTLAQKRDDPSCSVDAIAFVKDVLDLCCQQLILDGPAAVLPSLPFVEALSSG